MKPKRVVVNMTEAENRLANELGRRTQGYPRSTRRDKLITLLLGIVMIVVMLRVAVPAYDLLLNNLPTVVEMKAEIKALQTQVDSLKKGR